MEAAQRKQEEATLSGKAACTHRGRAEVVLAGVGVLRWEGLGSGPRPG